MYHVLSIDRNCIGNPIWCNKRISVPHVSFFHPTSVQSLTNQMQRTVSSNRDILISFCGAVRTDTRREALQYCNRMRGSKWSRLFNGNLCYFEDSLKLDKQLKADGIRGQGERRVSAYWSDIFYICCV